MSATKRFKQLLMVTGLLTLLGVAAMAGLIAYLWFDSKDAAADVDLDADVDTEVDADVTE